MFHFPWCVTLSQNGVVLPNAALQARGAAKAPQEHRLFPIACKRWLGRCPQLLLLNGHAPPQSQCLIPCDGIQQIGSARLHKNRRVPQFPDRAACRPPHRRLQRKDAPSQSLSGSRTTIGSLAVHAIQGRVRSMVDRTSAPGVRPRSNRTPAASCHRLSPHLPRAVIHMDIGGRPMLGLRPCWMVDASTGGVLKPQRARLDTLSTGQ
jgi:hypothetical protein